VWGQWITRGVLAAAVFVVAAALTTATCGPERTLIAPEALEHQCLGEKLSAGMPAEAQWQPGAIVQDPAGTVMLVLTAPTASIICSWDNPRQVTVPGVYSGTIATSGRLECPGAPGDDWAGMCFSGSRGTDGAAFAGRVPGRTARLAITYPNHQVLTTDVTSGSIALFGPAADLGDLRVRAVDGAGHVFYEGPLIPRHK